MMSYAFGMTDKGFKTKDLLTIQKDLQQGLLKEVDAKLHFGADSVAGVIVALVAMEARQVWEALTGLGNSLRPDTATGRALDALCSLTGTYRKHAKPSQAIALMTLDAHAKVLKGSLIRSSNGHLFKVTADVLNQTNTTNDIEADLIADDVGPYVAHPGTIAEIMTPSAGWSKAVIKKTYFTGYFDELDDDLRLRRMQELRAVGTSTKEAIRQRLLKIPGVQNVFLKEAMHNFEAIVMGGDAQEIAETLWQHRPIGVGTSGSVKCIVKDSIDEKWEVFFSRPTEVALKLTVHLKMLRELQPDDANRLKNEIADFSRRHFSLGSEIYSSHFFAVLLGNPIVLDVLRLEFSLKNSSSAPADIKPEQIATLAIADIDIKHTVEVSR